MVSLMKLRQRWRDRVDPAESVFRHAYAARKAWEVHCQNSQCECHPGRALCKLGSKLRREYIQAMRAADKVFVDERRGTPRSRVHRPREEE